MESKPKLIGYWGKAGPPAAVSLAAGAAELSSEPRAVAATLALGYPAYLLPLLGAWKVLSIPALLAPRLPRLKQWAYAGIFFDLTGPAASHAISGDSPENIAMPFVLL